MSPMMWTSLMIMFIILMIMSINIMYFNMTSEMVTSKTQKKSSLNWMW
nr:ATP synthase F0 subunit 8 [Zorka maculata]